MVNFELALKIFCFEGNAETTVFDFFSGDLNVLVEAAAKLFCRLVKTGGGGNIAELTGAPSFLVPAVLIITFLIGLIVLGGFGGIMLLKKMGDFL